MSWPLLVLHLSDLHFGPHSRFEGEDLDILAQRFHKAIEEARQDLSWKERVGLCIVTGDIAEAARPQEYKQALVFFEALVGCLGLERTHVIFAPGNHDVSWAITRKIEIDQGDEGFDNLERDRRIQQQKFQRFEAFLREFYGQDRASLPGIQSLGHEAFIHTYPDERLAVAVLNSCEKESHLHQGGFLSQEQAQALMDQWRGGEAPRWLKLIAVHHNPEATVRENIDPWVKHLLEKEKAGKSASLTEWLEHFASDTAGFVGREHLLNVAEDCRVQLIIHGHHHAERRIEWPWKRAKGRTAVLSAGSWGLSEKQLPENQPNMMHLLRIDPGHGEMGSVFRIYEPRARAEGQVKSGHFTVDVANPEGSVHDLSLPENFLSREEPPDHKSNLPTAGKVQGFIREYRARLKRHHDRWDLGGVGAVQSGGAGNPIEASLDDMYLPLRLAKGFDPEKHDAGQVLTPDKLISRKYPLVIRGAAGSGKTTWMRWTFRRLMEMLGALPFMLELRGLARAWTEKKAQGEERTIDAYLRTYVGESGAGGWQEALPHILQSETGPRPVLLVDGWDELGEMGEELRYKLKGFLDTHPHVLAVVSSRPYGQSQPTHSDGFELLDLQPLSDKEIARFTSQFHRRVYGEDEKATEASTERMQAALRVSPEALSLARTPLLLTMMLLISRDRPLPDKRHRLYEECIRNLLSARPEQRERGGAQLLSHQWRPSDSEERLRAVAAMATRMQQEGYEAKGRAQIVRSWEELETMLPAGWKREDKRGFLAWLVGAAGVMLERADGTLSFAHLSFQEYLVAHHLAASTEGTEARLQLCRERMKVRSWWETLRLWAAIVWDRNPEHLNPVLHELLKEEQPAGFWLVGSILADGPGGDAFDDWCAGLSRQFHVAEMVEARMSALAWAASRQEARRRTLGENWSRFSGVWSWLEATLARVWRKEARIENPKAEENALHRVIQQIAQKQGVARSRILLGTHPALPQSNQDLVLLRLVPTARSVVSARLQLLISLRVPSDEFALAARHLLSLARERLPLQGLGLATAQGLARNVAQVPVQKSSIEEQVRAMAREVIHSIARDWPQHHEHWGEHLFQEWMHDFHWNLSATWADQLAQGLARPGTLERAEIWAWDLARNWGLSQTPAWLVDFIAMEMASAGRGGTRIIVAYALNAHTPHERLLKAACQASLHVDSDRSELHQLLANHLADGDPLWPALARHLTHQSTNEDRALLIDLAQHPEKREPPLSWGLQYYVRGDLVFEDGREVTLDELCSQLGLPSLPYLEDMPPALNVDWDQKET